MDGTRPNASASSVVDLEPILPRVLAVRTIAQVSQALASEWKLPVEMRSVGLVTCTSDDALYVALDEGTKAAPVDVVYARSFYAGSSYASGPLSGEAIGVYAGRDPDEIKSALDACLRTLAETAWFYAADEKKTLAFFPHVIRSVGRYLAGEAKIAVGTPMAYLIAPPIESQVGLDAALKAAPVKLMRYFGPPTETNYGGGYLSGSIADCEAAARAFAAAVVDVAKAPLADSQDARGGGEMLSPRAQKIPQAGRYRVLATGERLAEKPEQLTHLEDDLSLVDKSHPRIALRGKLDTLQGLLLDAQVAADEAGARALVGELGEALELTRTIVGAEVTGRSLADWKLGGLSPSEIRYASHHTHELYNVPFMFPSVRQGPVVAKLYVARAYAREAELALVAAFAAPEERADLKLALNRLSSALYLVTVKFLAGRYGGEPHKGPIKGWAPPERTS